MCVWGGGGEKRSMSMGGIQVLGRDLQRELVDGHNLMLMGAVVPK